MREHEIAVALQEIRGFCDTIERRVREYGITVDSLRSNSDHADLVLMPLCQIGESVQSSRSELESALPDVPWHKMAGMRNVIVHGYTKVDPETIFATIQKDIPQLKQTCADILKGD